MPLFIQFNYWHYSTLINLHDIFINIHVKYDVLNAVRLEGRAADAHLCQFVNWIKVKVCLMNIDELMEDYLGMSAPAH